MPERRHFVHHPYGPIAAQFLCDVPRAALWAKPGMGKTPIVLSVLDALKLAGSSFFPALVIAPKRVAEVVWSGEIAKWDAFEDLTITKILGTQKERFSAISAKKTDLYVVNYDNVQWLCKVLDGKWPFKIVVADEASKLRGFRMSHGYSAARADALSYVAKHVGRWINLTGTPVANSMTALWGQTWFQDYGQRLGRTYELFLETFFRENKYTREKKLLRGAEDEIHKLMADIALSLRPEDWWPIEKPKVSTVPVVLPPKARELYREMEKKLFIQLDRVDVEAVNAGVKSMKLQEMASGFVYDAGQEAHEIHTAKLEALEDIVEENGEALLVGCHFKPSFKAILKAFPQARLYETEQDRIDWNAGKIEMMLLPYQSASYGLDMQDGGRSLVYYDQIWDSELREQVYERIGAMRQLQSGHNRTVLVYNIVAQDTLDVEVVERDASKMSVQDALLLARARRA